MESTDTDPEIEHRTDGSGRDSDSGKHDNQKRQVKDWFKAFTVALVCFILLRVFVFDINEVRGSSMEPALQRADKVFIDKITFRFTEPEQGDIVIFRKPGDSKRLIKRVIACPGDSIAASGGILTINGKQLDEPYVSAENRSEFPEMNIVDGQLCVNGSPVGSDVQPEGTVFAHETASGDVIPEDMFLVMGDNRQISLDSRNWGLLPGSRIVGIARMKFRLFPPRLKRVR